MNTSASDSKTSPLCSASLSFPCCLALFCLHYQSPRDLTERAVTDSFVLRKRVLPSLRKVLKCVTFQQCDFTSSVFNANSELEIRFLIQEGKRETWHRSNRFLIGNSAAALEVVQLTPSSSNPPVPPVSLSSRLVLPQRSFLQLCRQPPPSSGCSPHCHQSQHPDLQQPVFHILPPASSTKHAVAHLSPLFPLLPLSPFSPLYTRPFWLPNTKALHRLPVSFLLMVSNTTHKH